MQTTIAYRAQDSAARTLYSKALCFMPGGNTRPSIAANRYPVYLRSGRGRRVTTIDGEERIDIVSGFASAILGHADPEVMAAVREHPEPGTAFSMPTAREVDVVSLLVERVEYIE